MSTQLRTRRDAQIDCAYYAFVAGLGFAIFGGSVLIFYSHDEFLIRGIAAAIGVCALVVVDTWGKAALALVRLLRRG